MSFLPLDNENDFQSALDHSKESPVLLFKHSATCSLSARAHREMEHLSEQTEAPLFKVIVQESRPVSNQIEDTLGIRHETPQVIILRNGTSTYNASHQRVDASSLQNELTKAA